MQGAGQASRKCHEQRIKARAAPVRNRLVLLMNNNGGAQPYPIPGGSWQDTQIWELGPTSGPTPTWQLHFAIDAD